MGLRNEMVLNQEGNILTQRVGLHNMRVVIPLVITTSMNAVVSMCPICQAFVQQNIILHIE